MPRRTVMLVQVLCSLSTHLEVRLSGFGIGSSEMESEHILPNPPDLEFLGSGWSCSRELSGRVSCISRVVVCASPQGTCSCVFSSLSIRLVSRPSHDGACARAHAHAHDHLVVSGGGGDGAVLSISNPVYAAHVPSTSTATSASASCPHHLFCGDAPDSCSSSSSRPFPSTPLSPHQ